MLRLNFFTGNGLKNINKEVNFFACYFLDNYHIKTHYTWLLWSRHIQDRTRLQLRLGKNSLWVARVGCNLHRPSLALHVVPLFCNLKQALTGFRCGSFSNTPGRHPAYESPLAMSYTFYGRGIVMYSLTFWMSREVQGWNIKVARDDADS